MTDTVQKRASVALVGLPFRPPLIVPDDDLGDSDRGQIAFLYYGIDYAGDGDGVAAGVSDWVIRSRRRRR
jgi:hypothetical protein